MPGSGSRYPWRNCALGDRYRPRIPVVDPLDLDAAGNAGRRVFARQIVPFVQGVERRTGLTTAVNLVLPDGLPSARRLFVRAEKGEILGPFPRRRPNRSSPLPGQSVSLSPPSRPSPSSDPGDRSRTGVLCPLGQPCDACAARCPFPSRRETAVSPAPQVRRMAGAPQATRRCGPHRQRRIRTRTANFVDVGDQPRDPPGKTCSTAQAGDTSVGGDRRRRGRNRRGRR